MKVLLFDIGNSRVKSAWCEFRPAIAADGTDTLEPGPVHMVSREETTEVDVAWLKACAAEVYSDSDESGAGAGGVARGETTLLTVPDRVNVPSVAFSSVVPRVSEMLRRAFPAPDRCWQVTAAQDVGWPIDYPDREHLGADRLCAAAGARLLSNSIRTSPVTAENDPSAKDREHAFERLGPVIAIDFGTATTFNVVDWRGAFVGGTIAPGFDMMLSYLHEKTALLPELQPVKAERALGRNTREAMEAGAWYGLMGMFLSIRRQLCIDLEERETHVPLVATGGYAELVSGALGGQLLSVRPQLNLEGLASMTAHAICMGKLDA